VPVALQTERSGRTLSAVLGNVAAIWKRAAERVGILVVMGRK